MTPTQRLAELGLSLPEVPTPAGSYVPWTRHGDLVFTAGQVPMVDGRLERSGTLGDDLTTEEGVRLARTAALNVLAVAAAAADGLDVLRCVKLTVFVASTPDFGEQPQVANGASDLVGEVLGDRGPHARSAVGTAALPLRSPVEVEGIFAIG